MLVHPVQRQMRDHALAALAQEELAGSLVQPPHGLELGLGALQTLDIIGPGGARVRHVDLGRALLDQDVRDAAVDDVARALGDEDEGAVERPDGAQALLDHRPEGRVQQRPPALIGRDQQRRAVQLPLDAVEQIEQRGTPGAGVVQQCRRVEAVQALVDADRIARRVDDPAEFVAPAPLVQARTGAVRVDAQEGPHLVEPPVRRRHGITVAGRVPGAGPPPASARARPPIRMQPRSSSVRNSRFWPWAPAP